MGNTEGENNIEKNALEMLVKSYLAMFQNKDTELRENFGSDVYFGNKIELYKNVREWYEKATNEKDNEKDNEKYQSLIKIFTTGSNGTEGSDKNPLDYQIREHFKVAADTTSRVISANQQGGSFIELIKNANKKEKSTEIKLKDIVDNNNSLLNTFIDELKKSYKKEVDIYKFNKGGLFKETGNVGKELNYLLNFKEDNMPLINGCYLNAVRIINEVENKKNKKPTKEEEYTIVDGIKEKINKWKEEEGKSSKYKEVPTYYLIDQLFNVIDKLNKQKLDNMPEGNNDNDIDKNIKTFYQNCYDFCMQSEFYRSKNNLLETLINNKNTILYGPPGTGKTFQIIEFLKEEQNYTNEEIYKYVVFHPTYSYEDFIDGIKPVGVNENGQIQLKVVNGNFKDFCIEIHKKNKDFIINENKKELPKYYFIVDEVNRANLSAVFGETLMLLENSYRYKYFDNDKSTLAPEDNKANNCLITLQNSPVIKKVTEGNEAEKEILIFEEIDGDNYFGIPENIYFIGMMNNVDKSIDAFDLALRRRFKWIYKGYDKDVVKNELSEKIDEEHLKNYIKNIDALNNFISKDLSLGQAYTFGHSFFLKIENYIRGKQISKTNLENLFEDHLKPTLTEYLRTVRAEGEIGPELTKALCLFSPESKPKEKEVKGKDKQEIVEADE